MARRHSTRDILILAAVGVGAYLLFRNSGAAAAGGLTTATGAPVDFSYGNAAGAQGLLQYLTQGLPPGAMDAQGFPAPAFTPAVWQGTPTTGFDGTAVA